MYFQKIQTTLLKQRYQMGPNLHENFLKQNIKILKNCILISFFMNDWVKFGFKHV